MIYLKNRCNKIVTNGGDMLKGIVKMTAIALSASLFFSGMSLQVYATDVSSVLPSGGINIALSKGTDLEKIQVEIRILFQS